MEDTEGHRDSGGACRSRRPAPRCCRASGAVPLRSSPTSTCHLTTSSCTSPAGGRASSTQYDVSDPFKPGADRKGAGRRDHTTRRRTPKAAGELNGGPADGRSQPGRRQRIYITNSLYVAWDNPVLPPKAVKGWAVKVNALAGRRNVPGRGLLHWTFGDERVHQIRLQGGDSSSDTFCFPQLADKRNAIQLLRERELSNSDNSRFLLALGAIARHSLAPLFGGGMPLGPEGFRSVACALSLVSGAYHGVNPGYGLAVRGNARSCKKRIGAPSMGRSRSHRAGAHGVSRRLWLRSLVLAGIIVPSYRPLKIIGASGSCHRAWRIFKLLRPPLSHSALGSGCAWAFAR